MVPRFHAIAVDYDGTLTTHPRPGRDVLDAIAETRAAGHTVILVTGRILAELEADFPEVHEHFDAIVAENGAVLQLMHPARRVLLAPPVPDSLTAALESQHVPHRVGEVLLATTQGYAEVVRGEIARQGLECQLLGNLSELMVLPAGVSKGVGVRHVLRGVGISPHSCIGIGNADNDHSLLEACEIGVAVGDAIASLKARADLVLDRPNGEGVARFLRGPLRTSWADTVPPRWQLELGTDSFGRPVRLPASRVRMLIHGPSGSGKSYLAGLVCEELLRLDYPLCVIDPEGDHVGLDYHRGVVALSGSELPSPGTLSRLLGHGLDSVVLDLSLLSAPDRRSYAQQTLDALLKTRADRGRPHWLILDEAQDFAGPGPDGRPGWPLPETDVCFISWQPDLLGDPLRNAMSVTVATDDCGTYRLLGSDGQGRVFVPAERHATHLRHWHKYLSTELPPHHHFDFRDADGSTGRSARNLVEFYRELRRSPSAVLRHHAASGDLSRWVRQVIQDAGLARHVAGVEAILLAPGEAEQAREALLSAIEERYVTQRFSKSTDANGSPRSPSAPVHSG